MAYVGDGNNVTHSLLIVGALLGCNQVVVTPEGHEAAPEIVAQAKAIAEKTGVSIVESTTLVPLTVQTLSMQIHGFQWVTRRHLK